MFAGSMPLARMERLRPLLADSGGEARFTAEFEFDSQAMVTIRLEVEASLTLICQRSLEPYQEFVRRRSLLGIIENIAEEASMPEDYEPVLVEHGRLAMLDLVEDELLLGMPQVPKKPQLGEIAHAGVDTDSISSAAKTRRPFAGLAEQIKKHAQNTDK